MTPSFVFRAPVCRCLARAFASVALLVISVGLRAQFLPRTDDEWRALISHADLHYAHPVERSEDGLPIGNGRMGSLVWTTPTALKFQINRVDVQAMNRDTHSFFERNSDYTGGCGFVDIELGGAGADVFTADQGKQDLSVYDGALAIAGAGVTARALASTERDAMAIEIDDERGAPEEVRVNLRMLRFAAPFLAGEIERMTKEHIVAVQTRSHTATSQLSLRDGRIVLTQHFSEGDFSSSSAVVIGVAGRPARGDFANETEIRLEAAAARGRFVVYIASAASLDPKEDVIETALRSCAAAEAKGYAELARENAAWWHAFWSRGAIAMHSADGVADDVEANYHYFLYLMAATSRGKYPPKFNGMLWNTGGDLRAWGAQHWFANLSCYYEAIPATNRLELMEPMFAMYSGMYDSAALAARQEWGSEGIYLPETGWFDGLEKLPDALAAEMRALYLRRKPWEQRSAAFMDYASRENPYTSRWNWIGGGKWEDGRWVPIERGAGPYGPVSHILGTTAKIAYLYWRQYEYTLDAAFLRDRAYPMMRGAAEFYRHFPNLRRDADGTYHIHDVNSNEGVWGAQDTDEDLSAMRGIFAASIRAAELLNVDPELRAAWADLLAHLAPLPTSDEPDALRPPDYNGPRIWVRGLKPVANSRGYLPDGNTLPMWFFDLCNLESDDAATLTLANATFDRYFRDGIGAQTRVGVLSKLAMAAAALGRADAVRWLVPNQIRVLTAERATAYRGGQPLANRLTLREGPQAMDAQRIGRAAEAVHLALLQSNPPGPGRDPVIRVFPAWPKTWDVAYTLRARGAFVVSAAQHDGAIEYVNVKSEAGATCRLRNPWGDGEVELLRAGRAPERVHGALLEFPTRVGEEIRVTRE